MVGWPLFSLVAFSLAAPAAALAGQETRQQTSAGQEKPEDAILVQGEKDPKKRKVCRGAVSTGSIIRKQTCMSQADWQQREADDKATAEAIKEDTLRRQNTRTIVCAARNQVC